MSSPCLTRNYIFEKKFRPQTAKNGRPIKGSAKLIIDSGIINNDCCLPEKSGSSDLEKGVLKAQSFVQTIPPASISLPVQIYQQLRSNIWNATFQQRGSTEVVAQNGRAS